MAHLRTFKINQVNDSSEHMLDKKRVTLYNNIKSDIKDFTNACNRKKLPSGLVYNPGINLADACLVSAKDYDILLNVTKGRYLYHSKCSSDFSYSITGNINDANLLGVDTDNLGTLCYPLRSDSDKPNRIDVSINENDIYFTPGVTLVQDYSYNCDKSFFNMKNMQKNLQDNNYSNRLARQDIYKGFFYPAKINLM